MIPRPVRATFKHDYWDMSNEPIIELTCLMPYGVLIPLYVNTELTFADVKEYLWEESIRYPLHDHLGNGKSYNFVFVNVNAEQEEVFDERKTIRDVRPFCGILQVKEKVEDSSDDQNLKVQIGYLIGKSLHEFRSLKSAEVNVFRTQMKILTEQVAYERRHYDWERRMRYQFPPRMVLTSTDQQITSPHSALPFTQKNKFFTVIVKFNYLKHLQVHLSRHNTFSSMSRRRFSQTFQKSLLARMMERPDIIKNNGTRSHVFSVSVDATPNDLMDMVMKRYSILFFTAECCPFKMVMKVRGRDEYIYGSQKLIEFVYIYENLVYNRIPILISIPLQEVPLDPLSVRGSRENCIHEMPRICGSSKLDQTESRKFKSLKNQNCSKHLQLFMKENCNSNLALSLHKKYNAAVLLNQKTYSNSLFSLYEKFSVSLFSQSNIEDTITLLQQDISELSVTQRKKGKYLLSYSVLDKFKFKVDYLTNLNTQPGISVGVQVGIFHGGKALCESKVTREVIVQNGRCEYDETLQFEISVADIPRMARICFAVFEVCKNTRNARLKKLKDSNNQDCYVNPLGWVNTTLYDFKGQLKSHSATLYLWTLPDDLQVDNLLHPLSSVVSNPDTKNATALTITFHKSHAEYTVVYPDMRTVELFATKYCRQDQNNLPEMENQFLKHIATISDQVLRQELHEQERKHLWSLRYRIMRTDPQLLSKLLECVDWNNRVEVAEVITILKKWPPISPQRALELLDYAYADNSVRSYAVRCLQKISDGHLLLYLMQLVQALKYECYIYSDLVEFLLHRALHNQIVGHYLFWYLRSEMTVKSISVRFGLILEAYCRGSPEHVKILMKQMKFLEKLKIANELVKKHKDREKSRSILEQYFNDRECAETFSSLRNPLDPTLRCKKMKFQKCRIMDSKARPLWLVFENSDEFGDDIHMIFKNGDDLRQDMLTLQMLRIMDNLWKSHGLDLRINSYGCIATDSRVGLIEVVLNSETIANIQKEKGMFSATSAFKKGSILAWLKDHNTEDRSLDRSIAEFTYSCAGYCVATFVLGIADRHSDNIMIKRSGQLFHIDFGHILGHFKEKFGFRRERVPFVLTNDFVHVINKGSAKGEMAQFKDFQQLCKTAFLILRQHGSLILSLFGMMISTGLPELSSESDLNYLHESLVLHLSESDAEHYFQSKFSEALSNSWKTSLNWASHNVSKNNRL